MVSPRSSTVTGRPAWQGVTLEEAELFCLVNQLGSIHGAARQRKQEPATVSKIIRRLEEKVGSRLVHRSAQGVALTPAGQQVLAWAEHTIQRSRELFQALEKQTPTAQHKFLTIAGPSYVNLGILPPCLARIHEKTGTCFRVLELFPDQLVPQGIAGGFELAVHIGQLDWPSSWVSKEVADLSWGLFSRAGHPLGPVASAESVAEQLFILPASLGSGGVFSGNDLCPLPWYQRRRAFETQSAATAIQMTLHTDHLAFVPDIAAADALRRGEVTRIQVTDWPEISRPLYLSSRAAFVDQTIYKSLMAAIKNTLEAAR